LGCRQAGKAPDFDSGIRRFESSHPSQKKGLSLKRRSFSFRVHGCGRMNQAQLPKRGIHDVEGFIMSDRQMLYRIKVMRNGPYLVSGSIPMDRKSIVSPGVNEHLIWTTDMQFPSDETYALCRCGKSGNKPFCDGTHIPACFDGTETAGKNPRTDCGEVLEGPSLILHDHEDLCSAANFCHRMGNAWNAVEKSDEEPYRKIASYEASNCPSGRLVLVDKRSGKSLEPEFEPSVSILEDKSEGTGGPIWVKGSIPVESSDGVTYQTRNRMTLCRCGSSENKPFCDGTHLDIRFTEHP
jgi:CDGSH-type Zn-finger protein